MAAKRKSQSEASSEAALAAQLSTAEAHWQQQKLAARAAKAAAKDAKKAVKRLRKLLLASKEEKKTATRKQTTPARGLRSHLRIAESPEVRARPAKKRTIRRERENEPRVAEVQPSTPEQPSTAGQANAVPNGRDDGTQ